MRAGKCDAMMWSQGDAHTSCLCRRLQLFRGGIRGIGPSKTTLVGTTSGGRYNDASVRGKGGLGGGRTWPAADK